LDKVINKMRYNMKSGSYVDFILNQQLVSRSVYNKILEYEISMNYVMGQLTNEDLY